MNKCNQLREREIFSQIENTLLFFLIDFDFSLFKIPSLHSINYIPIISSYFENFILKHPFPHCQIDDESLMKGEVKRRLPPASQLINPRAN